MHAHKTCTKADNNNHHRTASNHASSSSSSGRLHGGLDCPICFEPYGALQCIPMVLSCGHTLCENCVSKGRRNSDKVRRSHKYYLSSYYPPTATYHCHLIYFAPSRVDGVYYKHTINPCIHPSINLSTLSIALTMWDHGGGGGQSLCICTIYCRSSVHSTVTSGL